jgi:hypothetical protein
MRNIIVILLITIRATTNLSAENIQKKGPAGKASTSISQERQILDCSLPPWKGPYLSKEIG